MGNVWLALCEKLADHLNLHAEKSHKQYKLEKFSSK